MAEPPKNVTKSHARHARTKPNTDTESREKSLAWRAVVIGVAAGVETALLALLAMYQPFSILAIILLSASVIFAVIIILSKLSRAWWFMQVAAWVLVGALGIAGVIIKVTQTRPQAPAQAVPCTAAFPKADGISATSSSSANTASTSTRLTFDSLPDWKSEGKVVPVSLTGTIPVGTFLWIFVYHAGLYYIQGAPMPDGPNFWQLATVNLGSRSGDLGVWFTIYAVQANSQANKLIQDEYNNMNNRNYGLAAMPGGSGAKKIAYMYACRSH